MTSVARGRVDYTEGRDDLSDGRVGDREGREGRAEGGFEDTEWLLCAGVAAAVIADPEPSAELATVEQEIGARRTTESELGEKRAIAKLATEGAESEVVSYFRDSEKLLTRRAALLAKIEGQADGPYGG